MSATTPIAMPAPIPDTTPAPHISVVMPVYNTQQYVESAVRSILDQTFRHFELIVVDDGSTDGSSDILDRLAAADSRMRIVRRPNTGITRALNDGLAVATAPLIARMDADDIALPTRLEKQHAFLNTHPDVGLLGCAWTTCLADGTRVAPQPALLKLWAQGPTVIAAELAQGHNCIAHPTIMFRRAIFDAAGGRYDPAYETAEDFECWLRMSRLTHMACLPEPLLDYRIHPQSICATRGHESIDTVRRAVHAHWAVTQTPDINARLKFHQQLATLHHSVRDRRGALRAGLRVLTTTPTRPATWWWSAKHLARVIKGPSY
ncbi:MAG: glycosyltransferase [Algisphaera sp.]